MGDNYHGINSEIEDQDILEANFTTLSTSVNNNTTAISNINVSSINNKLSGGNSSGLKTLIQGNDTDIQNIQTKTDLITISNAINMDDEKTLRITNTNKNSYPSGDATKVGHISVSSAVNLNTMNNSITTNTNAIDAVEIKTDNISVSSAVNLNTMTSGIATNLTGINGILNHSIDSNLKAFVDANSAKNSITTAQSNNITTNNAKVGITTTQINNITTNNAKVSSQWSNNGSEVYINQNVGIDTSNPNCNLEIGDNTGSTKRIRLNGPNGSSISSEILFTDSATGAPEYGNGMGIRFNTSSNRLDIIGDNGSDGTAEIEMSILRSNGYVGLNDITPSFRLDVNGNINSMAEYRYYTNPIPIIIAKTSLNSATVSTHRLGYGQGINNTGGTHTDNTFFMPDTNFKVVFRPTSSKVFIDIDYFMDRYFSSRNLYWALGTSSSQTSIIGRTLTFARGGNSEWTSRKEKIRIHVDGLNPYQLVSRYIFVKEIVVASNNTVGSNTSASWIHYGGYNTHSNGGGQTIGHYETDGSPQTPSNSDNFGALEATVYSVPSSFTSSSSTSNPFQYIGY